MARIRTQRCYCDGPFRNGSHRWQHIDDAWRHQCFERLGIRQWFGRQPARHALWIHQHGTEFRVFGHRRLWKHHQREPPDLRQRYGGLVNTGGSGVNQWVDRNSVIFTLNLPQGTNFTTASISNVAFQFGDAALGQTDFQVLPEPVTYSGAIVLLLVPLIWYKRRRLAAWRIAAG